MGLRHFAIGAAVWLACAPPSSAQDVRLEFANGRVTLVAENAQARAILAEWARLGGTRIVNGERVTGPPVTMELNGVPERQALDILLRGVAGYMMTARTSGGGASQIDRILILPTSAPPRAAAAAPVFGTRQPVVREPQDDAFGDEPDTPAPARRVASPRPPVLPVIPDDASTPTGSVTIQNGVPQTFVPGRPPAPGPTPAGPAATPSPANPFTTLPGSSRPGEITPPPQQENRPTQEAGPQER